MPVKSKSPSRRARSKGAPTTPGRRSHKATAAPGPRVYVRVRPKSAAERSSEALLPVGRDPRTLTLVNGRSWRFDGVLYEDCSQAQVYQTCVDHALEGTLTGKTTAVLCYGQSGAGKTYTMRGVPENPGVVPRVANALFTAVAAMKGYACAVTVSYVQVYLGQARDLLSRSPEKELHFRLEGDTAVFPMLTSAPVHSDAMLLQVYDEGDGRKLIRSSPISAKSSRGHTVFIIDVRLTPTTGASAGHVQAGRLMLVDLAGYEPEAAVARSSALVVQETRAINAALLRLHRTIAAAGRREKRLPYPDCPLAMLLKDAFQPQNWSAIILALSPSVLYKPHTYTTLLFGHRLANPEATERHPKQSWDVLKGRVVDQMTRAQAVLQWLKKQDPKEVRRFEATFGKVDSVDLSAQKVAQAISALEAMAPTAPMVPSRPEDAQSIPAQIQRLWAAYADLRRSEKQEFQREFEALQQQQAGETAALQRRGGPEEELARLRAEHAAELQLKAVMEEEHQAAAWAQLATELQSQILRSAAQYKLLDAKAEAYLQSTSAAVDLQQLREQTSGERPAPAVSSASPAATSVPILSASTLAAQQRDDLLSVLRSAPLQEPQSAAFPREDDPGLREQEEEDMRAYLGGGDGEFLSPAMEGPAPAEMASGAQSVASSAGPPPDAYAPPVFVAVQSAVFDLDPLLRQRAGPAPAERAVAQQFHSSPRMAQQASSPVPPSAPSPQVQVVPTPVPPEAAVAIAAAVEGSPRPQYPFIPMATSPMLTTASLLASPTYIIPAAPSQVTPGYRIPSVFPMYSYRAPGSPPVTSSTFTAFRSPSLTMASQR
eukprot:EG_transcript_2925